MKSLKYSTEIKKKVEIRKSMLARIVGYDVQDITLAA